MGFDIALDADAQGLAIASDLLPDERYTMNWETLLGMNLEEMTAGLLGTLEMQTAQTAAAISALEPLMEPYVAIVDEFMQELSVKNSTTCPRNTAFPPWPTRSTLPVHMRRRQNCSHGWPTSWKATGNWLRC